MGLTEEHHIVKCAPCLNIVLIIIIIIIIITIIIMAVYN